MQKKLFWIFCVDLILLVIALILYNPFLKLDLKGAKEVEILYGNEYKEEGYSASLFKDDLTSEVKVTNNINLKKVGTYKVKYVLEKWLIPREVVRTVKVVDKEKPVINLNGELEYSLCGKDYQELGYKASDNVDGDITNKVKIQKEKDKIIYNIEDSSGNKNSIIRTLILDDNKKPEIKLIGPELITLKIGSKYEELGFTVIDNCDVNLNEKVVISNSININKKGTYEIYYAVSDTSNNKVEVKRTVKVYEFDEMNAGYNEIVEGPTYINGVLIVNKKYSIPKDFSVDDTISKAALKELQEAAQKEGHSLPVKSGYRNYTTQDSLYNRYLKNNGKVYADGRAARAGHSEHQTGLAFDIGSVTEAFGKTKAGIWLETNCHKYGFIIRYPKYKELITGYNYEPWHIRYVGIDIATEIMKNNLTLEEFLGVVI